MESWEAEAAEILNPRLEAEVTWLQLTEPERKIVRKVWHRQHVASRREAATREGLLIFWATLFGMIFGFVLRGLV